MAGPLIDVDRLGELLDRDRAPVLLDVRWSLAGGPERADYLAGHIPGAQFVNMDADLASAAGGGGRHPLPSPVRFAAAMRRLGVRNDTGVVVYDAGNSTSAARAWWLLRRLGHEDPRVRQALGVSRLERLAGLKRLMGGPYASDADLAVDLLLFDSESAVQQPLPDAPLIGSEQRVVGPLVSIDESECGCAGQAVVGYDGAVVQRQIDQRGIRRRRHELVVAEIPGVVRVVRREISAHREIVSGHHFEGEAQIVGEGLQLLVIEIGRTLSAG